MAEKPLIIQCPTCRKEVAYEGNEYRPFCSERCRLLDLGAWADEKYALPAETETLSEEDLETIARINERNGGGS